MVEAFAKLVGTQMVSQEVRWFSRFLCWRCVPLCNMKSGCRGAFSQPWKLGCICPTSENAVATHNEALGSRLVYIGFVSWRCVPHIKLGYRGDQGCFFQPRKLGCIFPTSKNAVETRKLGCVSAGPKSAFGASKPGCVSPSPANAFGSRKLGRVSSGP